MPPTDLSALSRARGPAPAFDPAAVPRPSSRVLTRAALPAMIVLAALSLLGYAARESLRTTLVVRVAPVVLRAASSSSEAATATPGEVVQAPGWIEPDPSATGVAALAPGVLKELLVLDGERVAPGQAVARLIDDDAVLVKRQTEAQVARAGAAAAEGRAAVAVEEARADEARDAWRRAEKLIGTGAMGEGEIAAVRLRLASQVAAVATARAAVVRAEAEERMAQVGVDEAELALSRMTVHAPTGGVVLQRLVEPGQRLMPDANNPFAGVVVRLYDPAHLQVRVDVPLADAAKVRIGDAAEVTTEALPGRVFRGTLTRFVHEANLQKNTVQVKVSIADPAAELKPDMLAKARITAGAAGASSAEPARDASEGTLIAPRAALVDVSGAQASAWVLDRATSTAVRRTLRLGRVSEDSVEVLDGLRPGDRVVLNPGADLRLGIKVRAADEQKEPVR